MKVPKNISSSQGSSNVEEEKVLQPQIIQSNIKTSEKVTVPLRAGNNDNRSIVREAVQLENKAPLACAPPKCPQKKREPNRALAAKKIDNNRPSQVPKVPEQMKAPTLDPKK